VRLTIRAGRTPDGLRGWQIIEAPLPTDEQADARTEIGVELPELKPKEKPDAA
jgi:hypothetical protein